MIVPTIVSSSGAGWSSTADGGWHNMGGTTVTLNLLASSPVVFTWGVSVQITSGQLVTRLSVDGKTVAGSQRITQGTTYGSVAGTSYQTLSAGAHTAVLQYRANTSFFFDPSADWQSTLLQAMAFDQ